MARWRCWGVPLVCAGGVTLACGARSGVLTSGEPKDAVFPWESTIAPSRVRRPPECVQDWRTLYESTATFPPALAVAAGELIYGAREGNGIQIRGLDLASPSSYPRVIHTGLWYDELWLEEDQLLLWGGDQLVRVPIAGGDAEVLVDARSSEARAGIQRMLVERDAFYWVRRGADPTLSEIWRQPRGGSGDPQRIASIDAARFDARLMAATDDIVIVANSLWSAAVPLDGGALQPLDSVEDGDLAGVDGLGVYYVRAANRTSRGGRALEFEIRRAPADGSPSTRFWHRRAGYRLDRIWAADSGWLATGAYYMFDRTPHGVIAHIDEGGDELLIACDREDNFVIGRPVYWEGAFYAATRTGETWRVVEIRLPE